MSELKASTANLFKAATLTHIETPKKSDVKIKKREACKLLYSSTEKRLGRKLKLSEKIGLKLYASLPDFTPEEKRKTNSQALIGFIFGICSIVIFPVLAIPGFILSNNALIKEKTYPGILEGGNQSLAKAGKILSIVGFVYLLLIIAYVFLIIASFGSII